MFGLSILAGRGFVRRLLLPPDYRRRLASGCVALGLMLLVEFTFMLWIRRLTIREYYATRWSDFRSRLLPNSRGPLR